MPRRGLDSHRGKRMPSVDWFRHMWLAWGIAGGLWLLWFLVIEAMGYRKQGATLSETVWALHLPHAVFFALFAFFAWLCWHLGHTTTKVP
jgi:hypothetical protein